VYRKLDITSRHALASRIDELAVDDDERRGGERVGKYGISAAP
jgi:hypothetical protein